MILNCQKDRRIDMISEQQNTKTARMTVRKRTVTIQRQRKKVSPQKYHQ